MSLACSSSVMKPFWRFFRRSPTSLSQASSCLRSASICALALGVIAPWLSSSLPWPSIAARTSSEPLVKPSVYSLTILLVSPLPSVQTVMSEDIQSSASLVAPLKSSLDRPKRLSGSAVPVS